MIEQIREFFLVNEETRWVTQIIIVMCFTLIASFLVNRSIENLKVKFKSNKNLWDDALFGSIQSPVRSIIWIVGIAFALEIVDKHTKISIFSAVYPIRDFAVIACLTWFANGFIKQAQKNIIKKGKQKDGSEYDKTTADAVSKILRAAVFITASLVLLQAWGFSVGGVLAFGGVGGVAIGFAAKDLLANFFGAMMIYFDKPFKIGDWIRSPDREIEGVVEEIGWRQTRIITLNKCPLYVPNSVFSNIAVENPSRMLNRRIYETIGVRYQDIDKLEKTLTEINQMLVSNDEIDKNLKIVVNVIAFAPSSIDFLVSAFTHATELVKFHQVKQDVMLKIASIIQTNGAEIAFPTSTLLVKDAAKMTNFNNE
jgi:MscS family membrane protein